MSDFRKLAGKISDKLDGYKFNLEGESHTEEFTWGELQFMMTILRFVLVFEFLMGLGLGIMAWWLFGVECG